ncbi:hypothetical protein VBD025_17765 [Virgibacillus flavescens]|uniref:hypothetical protein n=1 Tax=Virgibacillus flavescens TaxID=1611422 RepID=UPI003D33456B
MELIKVKSSGISSEMEQVLKEPDIDKFLLLLQNYLLNVTANIDDSSKEYSIFFYRDLSELDSGLDKLDLQEKKLLRVKVNSLITYLEELNKITFPSPFVVGVYTVVVSFVLGLMIKDPKPFPEWTTVTVIICLVVFIPGISWFTLDQAGKSAELKEALSTIKELMN